MLSHPNCKINIGLHVVSKRTDGYHNLETIFYPVPLCDELEINPIQSSTVFQLEGIALDGSPDDNLCMRAYRLLRNDYPNRVGQVSMRLHKNIPFGAGLGGGSSDAAFVLKMLNELFHLELSHEQLCAYAARLGADCAFFIDNRPAFATGIGDCLSPVSLSLNDYVLVLIKPDDAVSTREAYSGVIPRDRRQLLLQQDLLSCIQRPIKEWVTCVENDFEQSVFATHPTIAHWKQWLYDAGAIYAAMSGSGATVYGIFNQALKPRLQQLLFEVPCFNAIF